MSNSNKIKYYFKTMLFISSLFLLSSCTPQKPKFPKWHTQYELNLHPKDKDGHPLGYTPYYSRSGVNSVDYVKTSELVKYREKKRKYDEYWNNKKMRKIEKEYEN